MRARALERSARSAAMLAAVGLGYLAAQLLGTWLTTRHGVAAVWPAAGVAMASLMLAERRRWPGILAVVALVNASGNLVHGHGLAATAGFALANVAEPLVAMLVLRRYRPRWSGRARVDDLGWFALTCVVIGPAIGAALGAAAIIATESPPVDFLHLAWSWAITDAAGILMVTPAIVVWCGTHRPRGAEAWHSAAEVVAVSAVAVSVLALGALLVGVDLLAFPVLLVLVARRRLAGAVLAIPAVSLVAIAFTVRGWGAFGALGDDGIVAAQVFVCAVALALLLAGVTIDSLEAARRDLGITHGALNRLLDTTEAYVATVRIEPGRIVPVYAGPGRERLVGHATADADLHAVWRAAVHPDDLAAFDAFVDTLGRSARSAVGGELHEQRYRLVGPDGEVRWVADRFRLHVDPTGHVTADVVVLDITEVAKLEGELLVNLASLASSNAALEEARSDAERRSRTDPLTGVLNRRALGEQLDASPGRTGLVILDVDHFKRVNDTLGHDAGDDVLVEIAARLAAVASAGGRTVARLGGEEFAVVAGAESEDVLAALGERLRLAVSATPVETRAGAVAMTASVGVCARADDGDAAFAAADRALYAAKRLGRDRVCVPGDVRTGDTARSAFGPGTGTVEQARALARVLGARGAEALVAGGVARTVARRLGDASASPDDCELAAILRTLGAGEDGDGVAGRVGAAVVTYRRLVHEAPDGDPQLRHVKLAAAGAGPLATALAAAVGASDAAG